VQKPWRRNSHAWAPLSHCGLAAEFVTDLFFIKSKEISLWIEIFVSVGKNNKIVTKMRDLDIIAPEQKE
jgi:hypothetical protein